MSILSNDFPNRMRARRGQSLVEVLVALAIGAILVGAAAFAIAASLRSNADRERSQIAAGLAGELAENVDAVASANWLDIYNQPVKGPAGVYSIDTTGGTLSVVNGSEVVLVNGVAYTRFFNIDDVCRASGPDSLHVSCSGGGAIGDPSTQKISVQVSWSSQGATKTSNLVRFIARTENAVFVQGEWSGGAGALGPFDAPTNVYATSSNVNISSSSIRVQGF